MPVGAVIGSAAIGAGTSIMQSNAQNSAARNATAATQQSTDQQVALYRDIYNQNRADYEPFRQYELQQANAMGEMFGFNPVGQQAAANGSSVVPGLPGSSVLPRGFGANNASGPQRPGDTSMPQMRQQMQTFPGAEPGVNGLMMRGDMSQIQGGGAGFNQSAIGTAQIPGQPHQPGQPGNPQVMNPLDPNKLQPQSVVGADPAASAAPAGTQPLFDPSLGGADRFNNSLFNPVAQNLFNTQRDNIDNNLAGQGAVYSSARQNAVQQAGVNSSQSALGMYLNALMGAPSTQATQASANAGQNFASQTGNALGQQGAYQAQSAYNQGQNRANMWDSVGSNGAFALGAMNFGGKK